MIDRWIRRRGASLVLCALIASACGSSSAPSAPSASAKAFRLSGTVRAASSGAPLAGAKVTIMDGPAAQQSVQADGTGAYVFASVASGGFTLQASAPGYTPLNAGITLTADVVQDFALVRLAVANLQLVPGSVTPQLQTGSTWLYAIPAINQGDGCAGSVSGTTTFADNNGTPVATVSWTLPAGTIIRPGQQFTFAVVLTNDAAFSNRTYDAAFQYLTVACP